MALTQAELDAAQAQINAARDQAHTNIGLAEGWAQVAQDAAEASGAGSAQVATAEANRAGQQKVLAETARTGAEVARSGAETAQGLAEGARDGAVAAEAVAAGHAGSVATAVEDMKAEILGGAGPAFDTLAELKAAYESADESLAALIGGKAEKTDPRFTDARTPKAHRHDWDEIDGVPTEFPPTAHPISKVTGLQAALDGKEEKPWQGTQAQYDALGSYESDRTYYITD